MFMTINIDKKRLKQISDRISKVVEPIKKTIKEISMRELNRRMRINEEIFDQEQQITHQEITGNELKVELEKFKNVFADYNVAFEFEPIKVIVNSLIWGGTIDNEIQWVYKVADSDEDSGVELNFAPGFNPDDEDNKKIIDLLQNYYNEFFKYWRDNLLNLSNSTGNNG